LWIVLNKKMISTSDNMPLKPMQLHPGSLVRSLKATHCGCRPKSSNYNSKPATMKKYLLIRFYFIISQWITAQVTDTLIDFRDGQVFKTIKLGSQVWMGENLNYTTDSSSWCYDNLPENCIIYGRLYTWEIGNKVCPVGWHLPGDEEWKTLNRT
jgi:hypothetical protein